MSDPADENLLENPFFLGLGSHFPLLISKLVHQEGWKCVVPASGSWNNRPKKKPRSEDWTYQEFATHILVPTARNHQFKNLLDQPVWIRGDRIFGSDPDEADPGGLVPAAVRILFQETYYDDEDRKFNLICVDRPLPMDFSSAPSPELEGNPLRLETFQDCHNFLRAEPEALQILKILDEASRAIKKGKISSKDLKELYSKTVRELMAKCPKIGEKSQKCRPFFQHLRKALETILINSAYAEIYGLVQSECRQDDSKINKHVQNAIAVNVRPADLGLEHPALIRSLNKARLELIKLAAQKTPLEKIRHVKNCLKILSSCDSEEELRPVSTDDLLPAIILILVKSGLRDLATQFHFLSDLRFSSAGPQDEDAFVVATFEAALEHVKSGRLETDSSRYRSGIPEFVELAAVISETDATKVANLFQTDNNFFRGNRDSDHHAGVCHPLCSCQERPERESKEGASGKTHIELLAVDEDGNTPIHVAAKLGNPLALEVILSLMADPSSVLSITNSSLSTPIHLAASHGHQGALLLLINSAADTSDLNARDRAGNTALSLAAHHGHSTCVKALIFFSESKPRHLDLNGQNKAGNTPLHLAARWGFEEIVMLLLDYGARTDIRNERHELAADCTIDPELAKALTDGSTEARRVAQDLDFFASPAGQRSNPPTTPFKAVKSGNLEQLQECLNSPDHRCDLDTPDKKTGKTLLHISSEMGMLRITEELVRAGADPQVPSPASHKIPLHLACKGDHLEVSRFLCSAEDDDGITYRIVNSQDRLGNSPLHYAVANGSLEMAAMLLGKGSRLDLTNVLGKRPVDIAVDQSREALVKLLSSSDKKVTPQRFP